MAIVDHALHALTDEVIIPRSGWEREPNEDSKPRHIEWESVLTNTAGCLRYGGGLPATEAAAVLHPGSFLGLPKEMCGGAAVMGQLLVMQAMILEEFFLMEGCVGSYLF